MILRDTQYSIGLDPDKAKESAKVGYFCSMKATQDVRDFAATQGIGEKVAREKGMEAKAVEFVKSGAEVYRRV